MADVQDVKIWDGNSWISLEGPQGENGTSASVDAGTTTTSAPGGDAAVENVGTTSAAMFNFTIPRGATGGQGNSGTQQVGKVDTTTSNAGGNAAVKLLTAAHNQPPSMIILSRFLAASGGQMVLQFPS